MRQISQSIVLKLAMDHTASVLRPAHTPLYETVWITLACLEEKCGGPNLAVAAGKTLVLNTSDDAGHRGASLSERLTDVLILTAYLVSLACRSVANSGGTLLFRRPVFSLVWGARPFAKERKGLVTSLYPR